MAWRRRRRCSLEGDNEMTEKLFKGNIIDEWTKQLMSYTDAPEIFIRACGYYLVSATLGEFYVNKLVPFGSQRPNLWIILSSIPGRMRRSSIQGITYRAFKRIVGKEQANIMVIEEGTPEGLMDAIEEEPNSSYTIQSTEWGIVVARITSRDHYQAGVSSLLSKLYYGEGGKQSLSQRGGKSKGRTLPEGLFVTMLTGLQEAHRYFKIHHIEQGFLRRLLIIYVDKAERWKKPIDIIRKTFNVNDIVAVLKQKRQRLLQENRKVSIILMPDAEDRINEYSRKLDAELDKTRDYVALYKQSLWEHLLKLATIHAIARTEPQIVAGEPLLHVTIKDVEAAEKIIKRIEKSMVDVIDKIGEEEQPIRVQKLAESRVYRRIAEYGKNGVGYNELHQKHFKGWKRDTLGEIIDNLRSQDRIVIDFIKTGEKGRPPRVLKAKEYV